MLSASLGIMSDVRRVLPADLAVGDRIYLAPLAPFSGRVLDAAERVAASAGPVAVTGFGGASGAGTVVVRTGVFDALVPCGHRVAVVVE